MLRKDLKTALEQQYTSQLQQQQVQQQLHQQLQQQQAEISRQLSTQPPGSSTTSAYITLSAPSPHNSGSASDASDGGSGAPLPQRPLSAFNYGTDEDIRHENLVLRHRLEALQGVLDGFESNRVRKEQVGAHARLTNMNSLCWSSV